MKYSIIYPYYKRPQVIDPTLSSLVKHYSGRHDFEVIFVLDLKNTAAERDVFFSHLEPYWDKIRIVVINNDIFTYNSCRAYNLAVERSTAEYIVISNPECLHKADILGGLDREFDINKNVYVLCACESINEDGTFVMWYQHSLHNNRLLHFCTAISKRNFLFSGGFNEEYIYGIAYEDDEWRKRILRDNYPIVYRDDLLVSHIEHARDYLSRTDLVEKNKNLYVAIWEQGKR
jgi:glycosyltransferase involved in cell wall biosynthesis